MTMDSAQLHTAARSSRIAALITAGGGFLVAGAIVYSAVRLQSTETRVAALHQQADSLDLLIAARESVLVQVAPIAAKGLGYAQPDTIRSASFLRSSLSASTAVDSLGKSGMERRRRVTVRYYPREFESSVNAGILLPELRRAGFTLEKRPTEPGMSDVETNALWFGTDVSPEDVKLVALLLTSAGARLRAIRPFRDPGGLKRAAIEIGGDRAAVREPVWSVERILSASAFTR